MTLMALFIFIIALLVMCGAERIRRAYSCQGYEIDSRIVYANLAATAVWTVILWVPMYAIWTLMHLL
ncbi:MAG: hypothetical protein A3H70_01115 [Candidatus Komeilibacteria bacterium RIFCSPLOWO2_02_FULL_48_11]|uniref:Uncharacterized protein n=1 Tax=Candidatus Komeilibacteria bacterium RIFCSPLOWO2_02_FULL_48_11 TaxID=1798553 RepID=A0A1G2BSE4_9BACT|nr:MAG: hypothetical protein A3H70_01115 [Candidatus Komeilibacteria bacterium RIFCSPLOWO2_02_FULL_48_11]